MRGPKPTPTLLAELHGSPGKRRKNRSEPKPLGDLTAPPDWLTDGAKESFYYALQHSPPGLLRSIDRTILALWAQAEDIYRQAVTAQADNPLLVRTSKDNPTPMQSPWLPVINKQAQTLMKLADHLGFSPASRPRIGRDLPAPALPLNLPDAKGAADDVPIQDFLAAKPDPKKFIVH